jgi:hypothetical protein
MLGKRQLFVYWRVAAADAAAAAAAIRGWQSKLHGQHPALHAHLFTRVPQADDEVTLMETYAIASAMSGIGIDAALQRRIEAEGQSIARCWLRGVRHIEVFDACDD